MNTWFARLPSRLADLVPDKWCEDYLRILQPDSQ